jgi:hypothetical protein
VRLYGAEAVAAIRAHVRKIQARRQRATGEGAGYWQGLAALRVAAGQLGKLTSELRGLYRALRKNPPTVSTLVHSLPHPGLALAFPVAVLISPLRRVYWRASLPEGRLEGRGKSHDEAIRSLRHELVTAYLALREAPEQDPERWNVLEQLIRERRPRPPRAEKPAAVNEPSATERGAAAEHGEQPPSPAADERRDA